MSCAWPRLAQSYWSVGRCVFWIEPRCADGGAQPSQCICDTCAVRWLLPVHVGWQLPLKGFTWKKVASSKSWFELSPGLSLRETEKSHLWLMVLFKNWVGAAPVWIVNSAPNDWCQVWGVHIYCWWVMRHNAVPAAHCALWLPASLFELSSCGTSFYW